MAMKKRVNKKSARKAPKVRDLPVRKGPNVKGGSSAISEVMKNFGSALQTAAWGG